MIYTDTRRGTKVAVSLIEDVEPNKGGYYCEVYLMDVDDDPIDNFVIPTTTLEGLELIDYINNAVYSYLHTEVFY